MLNNISMEETIKLFIAVTGLITLILKLVEALNVNQKKKDLVLDLELLQKTSKLNLSPEDDNVIKEQIKLTLAEFLEKREKRIGWFNLFYSLVLFVGFGWWTLEIYKMSVGFNPWLILTTIFSFVGLGLLLENNWMKRKEQNKEKIIFKIIITKGITTALVFTFTTISIGLLLYLKILRYSHWMVLIGALFLMGLKMLYDSIRVEK